MDAAQKKIIDNIAASNNVLVTVSKNPSVDELSAALGLTLLLDKMGKRATAIFSGAVPAAINFLEPDKTFEDSADSLRDFIIALDKEKADHLRYKVDGDVVKIFITPYKTTLSEKDLEFSQGDYNVELVVALGVKDQDHLDGALDAHGKILHDAKVVTITAGADASNLGSADWHENEASSLCEMVGILSNQLNGDSKLLDEQISTALLTGIVSSTDRFSNDRTSSRVMTMAAQLMAAGANQQLIAAKLEEGHDIAPGPLSGISHNSSNSSANHDDTELVIQRDDESPKTPPRERVLEPLPEQLPKVASEPVPKMSGEDSDQAELEKQLAGIATSDTTMADIEQELQASKDEIPAVDVGPLTASQDASMPGFEPTAVMTPAISVVPEMGAQPVEPEVAAPPTIIQEHGPISVALTGDVPPINSIQSGQEEEVMVDPLNGAEPKHIEGSVYPSPAGGTTEGAAALASSSPIMSSFEPMAPQVAGPEIMAMPDSVVEPVAPPFEPQVISASQTLEPEVPELPPLPPLPSDMAIPPLPPPPPAPSFDGQGGVMPSGAVSGDVFGDGGTPPALEQVAVPEEPGLFKIPTQA